MPIHPNHLLALFFIGINIFSISPQSHADVTEEDLLQFSSELNALRIEQPIPGLAAAIVKDHELLWSQGYGYTDVDSGIPVQADTPFWIASVTKTFVGLTFLHLESAGLIDLTELAADTPKFDSLCNWLSQSPLPFGKDLRCDAPITIQNILNHQVQGEPGTAFSYNPLMYSRLSRYLEHKLGEGIDAVEGRHNYLAKSIDRFILEPAGMSRTLASQWDRSKALVFFDMANGFSINANNEWFQRPRPERHIAGGAGVVSTVLDLAKYDIAIDTGVIASPAIRNKLFTAAPYKNGDASPYAYGWYVQDYNNEKLVWHSGWDEEAGFSALYLKIPDKKLTLILLANGEGLRWGNPLDKAMMEKSPFAQLFMQHFVFSKQ